MQECLILLKQDVFDFVEISFKVAFIDQIFFCLITEVGIVCVTLLDRLENDQITVSDEAILEFQERPFEIIGEYIRRDIESNKN